MSLLVLDSLPLYPNIGKVSSPLDGVFNRLRATNKRIFWSFGLDFVLDVPLWVGPS